jgi:threonine dehydratase
MIAPTEIAAAERAIRAHIRRTPVLELDGGELGADGAHVTLKLELTQHAGAFKTRGAFANLLLRPVPAGGVIAASGGNHGAAVAYAAGRLGHRATIFVPTICSPAKIERIRRCGATLEIIGQSYDAALAASRLLAARTSALEIHAFDQDETILGQGTVALELEQQAPALDTILVPVGGGGLASGIASWYAGRVRLVAVEPELAPTLTRALEAGAPVDAPVGGIAADSLAPARIGERNFPILRRSVDRVLLVPDDAIREAQETLWRVARVAAEPGGAATTAALARGLYRPRPGERIGIIVSGGNTAAVDFTR